MKLPALSSSDQDRARIVLIVIGTLCVISVVLVLAVIVLTAIHEPVPTELWTLTTSIVTAMVALLVKVSSTEGGTQADPVPVTVADEPVQVQQVPAGFGEPTWSSSTTYAPAPTSPVDNYRPEDNRLVPAPPQGVRPSPYPNR